MIEHVPHARLLRPPLAIATAPEATPTAPLCKLFGASISNSHTSGRGNP